MRCSRCQAENREGLRFCEDCGARLAAICPSCGVETTPGKGFCGSCGTALVASENRFTSPEIYTPRHLAEKILTSRVALEGERKQVTVLFADMKGSMALLADRDPEEARKILDPVLEFMMEAVHRYEGTVNQVMGDGIMALFGAPLACEDHAVRACYAALRMQDTVKHHVESTREAERVPFQIRVGLNSGEVVVRSIGSDLHMDYTAVGQTTHVAARMEQMALPGSILLSAETLALAEGYVEVKPLGPMQVKGLTAPLEAYELTRAATVRSRFHAAAARGLTRFVGRQSELDQLRQALERARAGHGQVVAVVGEPGVGKSRLCWEFSRSHRTHGWLILESGSLSYGKAANYLRTIELLRAYFSIESADDTRAIREKVTGKVLSLDPQLELCVSPILWLLDVPVEDQTWHHLDPPQRRQRVLDAVRHLLVRESQVQPVMLLFEDLHWIDAETQAMLDGLVENLPTVRMLLLVNYRHEYQHRWGSKTYYTQLGIDSLPRVNAEELLRALVGDDPTLHHLKELLIGRTQGNPFFLEECVRTLAEHGILVGERGRYRATRSVETIDVPTTVQAVLAARIDRLAAEDKRLLQCASVIGESVPLELLQTIADLPEEALREGLDRLRAGEFLYDITAFSTAEYVFKHGLTHQVAYSSLLHERRRALHARLVEAIELRYPGRLAEHVERLGHHATLGRLWDRAARYLREAGVKAFARSANRDAVSWFERALQALRHLPESPDTMAEAVDLHLGLRNALAMLGEHEATLMHLSEAEAMAERIGDRRRLGRALSFEVNCLFLLGRHDAAIDCARRAQAVAEALCDTPLAIVTDMYAARAHMYLGDFTHAIKTLETIIGTLAGDLAGDHLGLPVLPAVFARSQLVEALVEVGRFAESARHAAEALALAEGTNHPDTLLWAYHGLGIHHLARRDATAAVEALEHAYSLGRTHDMPAYAPRIGSELALAWALAGRVGEAISMVERAVDESTARKQVASYSKIILLLAEVYLLGGRLERALEAASRGLDLFRRQRERGHEAWALRLLGDIASDTTPVEAERYYRQAAGLATELGMSPLVARCQLGLGHLLHGRGDIERAVQALEVACGHFRTMEMSADLTRSASALEALRRA